MKLYIINPDYGVSRKDMDERCEMLSRRVGPDVTLHMDCLTETKVEINSASDVCLAAPEIIRMGKKAEREGFDAVILYCFSDPAVDALREQLTIPVIGGAQAALLAALPLCRQMSILLADPARIPEKEIFVRTLGISSSRIGRVEAIDFQGKSIWDHREEALQALIRQGQAMKEEGAQCIVLGCLSFLGLAAPLAEAIGLPIIDPALAAVAVAEATVRQGLSTSKISFPRLG